ncbi:MAG TPA: cupin domain-containing protein [Bryobacteraceae bacterium]|nr:cupin domain-containing protein [Bryobacteraceae bacterium]
MKNIWLALCLIAGVATAQNSKVTPLMTKDLAAALIAAAPQEGAMTTVEYEPGASSAAHRHNAYVFVYVLEGSVVMQVKGGKEVTLNPGETFYESPGDIHSVSRNASKTNRAKILVFMVKKKGAPVTLPAN